jgi:hypothetical protein
MKRWCTGLAVAALLLGCSPSSSVTKDGESFEALVDGTGAQPDVRFPLDIPAVDVESVETFDAPDVAPADLPILLCQPGEGCFMDSCSDNGDCQSGWCVEHLGQQVCTQTCQEECPAGWTCQQVAGSAPDLVFVCVSDYPNLCRPCTEADDCQGAAGTDDACLEYGEQGAFCGGRCGDDGSCPWGFACQTVATVDGIELEQCVAETGECPCTDSAVQLGLFTACQVTNDYGSCAGKRVCTEGGLTDCDAAMPAPETCNGTDDDCDGDVDEPDLVEGDFVNLCDDGNQCTDDKCTGAEGCSNEMLDGGACEDGDPCTVADHCLAGQCVGDPVQCDDKNPCTDDICTETGGCLYVDNQDGCDDDDPCTVGDLCASGSCAGTPVSCQCQDDADCAPMEDGNLCNGTLTCDKGTFPYQCVVNADTVKSCPEPEGPDAFCLKPACDPVSGECSIVPHNPGLLCDDGNACLVNATCQDGACAGGQPVNCNDGNACTDDSCNPESGCLHKNNEIPCQDGNACTILDTCGDGACLGGGPLDCNDGNPCTMDTCDPDTGCGHEPQSDAPCDDDNACTLVDTCQAGACTGSQAPDCADDNPCTDDLCDPIQGCVTLLNDDLCDDDNICTVGDRCELGVCTPKSTLQCDDGNLCTDDSCDPDVGCQFMANQVPCSDGNGCTVSDQCDGGWCVPGPSLDCDDDNVCTVESCDPAVGCVTSLVEEGTNCGETADWQCVQGGCVCIPKCAGKSCGDDSCGGTCGVCEAGYACQTDTCESTGAVWFKNSFQQITDPAIAGARTYSFWFYLNDVTAAQTLLIKKDTPGAAVPARPVNLAVKEGQLHARMMWEGGEGSQELATAAVEPYTWYHVVWQASPDLAQLYLNGTLAAQQELPGTAIDNEFDYTVGGAPITNSFGNFVAGYIYNLRIAKGFVYDGDFTPCVADVLDQDSYLIDGAGPMACNCQPACGGKSCGADGCGGQCGTCGAGTSCQFGVCLAAGPDCLAARYSLAGDALDDSGNGHHCDVLSPVPAPDRFSSPSEALAFDGTEDYVNCGDSDVLESTSQFTISLWVKLASLTANPLVNKWYSSDTNNRNSYSLHARPDGLRLTVSNGTLKFDRHDFPFAWQTGHWYHVVATYQAGTVEAFIDGQSQGKRSGTITAIGNVNDPLKFGDWIHQYHPDYTSESYYPLDGALDDVRMYACTLSGSDVLSLYNGGQ